MASSGNSSEFSPPRSSSASASDRGSAAPPPSSPTGATNNNAVAVDRRSKRKRSSNYRVRRESIVVIFVIMFVLNSLNAKKILQSVNSQFDELSRMVYFEPPVAAAAGRETTQKIRNETTAVIITSSWIPIHPSTYMVEMVLNSTFRHMIGLSPTAPVFITVDHFRWSDFSGLPAALEERIAKLEEYTNNLLNIYLLNPNIHVLPAAKQLHIGGSVMKALNLIERHYPTVRYVYSLQHDFQFTRNVDHLGLERLMDRYQNKINYVRFPKKEPWRMSRSCAEEKPIIWNETAEYRAKVNDTAAVTHTHSLHPTMQYSDNNHLVRHGWYKSMIAQMINLRRAPENPLQRKANEGCWRNASIGLYLYHQMNMAHLDGRRTAEL